MRIKIIYFWLNTRSCHLRSIQSISFNRIFISKTFSSCQLIQSVVWLRTHYIVLNFDYFTVFCTNKSCCMITVTEIVAFFTCRSFCQCFSVNRLSIHSNQSSHTVTTVNIQCLSNRAKAVSSINITTIFHVITQAPS